MNFSTSPTFRNDNEMNDLRFRHYLCLLALTASSFTLSACGEASDDGANGGSNSNDPEAPASCDLLSSVTGSYTVTGEPTENEHRGPSTAAHTRGTITVDDSFAIDFDEGIAFTGADISACYDRTNQDHDRRVQVSYGADDNGQVINFYLTANGEVDEIQFRHNDEGVNIRVLVSGE